MAGKKKPTRRQLGVLLDERFASRVERTAERLGLDTANFLRLVLRECLPVYERRADRLEKGEMPPDYAPP